MNDNDRQKAVKTLKALASASIDLAVALEKTDSVLAMAVVLDIVGITAHCLHIINPMGEGVHDWTMLQRVTRKRDANYIPFEALAEVLEDMITEDGRIDGRAAN